ncbi:PQQ-dependent sugar dehydrogenase [Arthrobacter sp. OY3WO11]|uniref:PQQ-dependent sugar dehydrogenase n=1 Tax=Arthrobacter sp. OY3WO11 TaxID=1835723 RepID=UPI0007CFF69E|nr:PQQ-dependent sugar dehydrogenase [Arthrobacter sp. OY3WO11]OAE03081.1 glucose dehydrogenase [Arthrobacter sp. OY3WO11]
MKATRTPALLAVFIGAGLMLASCTATPPAASPTPVSPPVTSEVPSQSPSSAETSATAGNATPAGTPQAGATGLEAPWSVVFRNGTPLVSERDSGRILELSPDGTTRTVGDIPGVAAVGEGGLLGLAVDSQGRLYVYSTGTDGNRLQRFDVTGEPGALALGQPETLLDGIASASYHDGGRIAFGPDGMLYVATGDAGRRDSSQDLDSLNGKILRMTPGGGVPGDNPFPDSLVYSYGHRNPQGMAWAEDGTMFATEFGQNTWDELNIITAGANYGWPTVEGIATRGDFTDPAQQWEPTEASPSGMAHIDGTLFIANLRGQVLRAVPVANPSTSTTYYDGEFGRIRDVTQAPDGRLWFVTNNTDGRGRPGADDDRILSVDLTRQ